MYNYSVDKSRAVSIFKDGIRLPILYQKNYPNGERFENGSAAKRWAEAYINFLENDSVLSVSSGRNSSSEPVPSSSQILDMLKIHAERYEGNVPEDLVIKISELETELS